MHPCGLLGVGADLLIAESVARGGRADRPGPRANRIAPRSPTIARCSPPSPNCREARRTRRWRSPSGIAQRVSRPRAQPISRQEWERVFEVDLLGVLRTVLAGCRRSSSGAARSCPSPPSTPCINEWATAPTPSPRPWSKSSSQPAGRAPPQRRSATVAYLVGWTRKLVQDAFDGPDGGRINELPRDWLLKRSHPLTRRRGLSGPRGTPLRASFVPKWVATVSAFRGPDNPLLAPQWRSTRGWRR